ncbi:C39 family peptidase [Mycolicibacterium sp. CBM1]
MAAAAPDDSGHTATTKSAAAGSTSSARSARPTSGSAAKTTPVRASSSRNGYSAPVVQLHATKRATPATSAPPGSATDDSDGINVVPTASAKQAAPKRAPGLPTPDQALQTIAEGLGGVRRNLDDLRGKIETLVQNQIAGFQNSLLDLQIDLQRLVSNKPLLYGNPANSQFWAAQGDETAYLMAAVMAINRLTGETVTADSLVAEAMATDSTIRPDRKMYLGPTTSDYVWPADAYQLMEKHGVTVTSTFYNLSQGRRALNAVETALAEGKTVITTINGPTVSILDPTQQDMDQHPVVVLAIDVTNNVVYFNDGALPEGGQKRTMSLDKFIDAWRASFYSTTFAEAAAVTPQTESPATEAVAA